MRAVIVLLAATACVPDVREDPSFQVDVLPILAANCVRCHGAPTLGGAPTDFRLDVYADLGLTRGAATYAVAIDGRVHDPVAPMPPRFGLDDDQLLTLERWVARGAGRGPIRAANNVPALAITGAVLRVEDVDDDVVGGRAVVDLPGRGSREWPLHAGTQTIDLTGLPAGSYPLSVELDDGAATYRLAERLVVP